MLSSQQLARAAWLKSDRRGVVSGLSASALLGAKWIDAGERAEIIHSNRRPPAGLVVHSDTLAPGETTEVSGMPVDGGSESPYESLTRLMLVRAGFPRPMTQIKFCDRYGLVPARLDMGWPEYRVADETTLSRTRWSAIEKSAEADASGDFLRLTYAPRTRCRSGSMAWSSRPQYAQLCVPLFGKLNTPFDPPAAR